MSLHASDNAFRCSGIVVLKLTNFKVAQEIANLLVEKLEHAVKVEFKFERSEDALREARQRASTGAVADARLKAQSMIGGGKLAIVSVRQLEEAERPLSISAGGNRDAVLVHWTTLLDDHSLTVLCRVHVAFRSND